MRRTFLMLLALVAGPLAAAEEHRNMRFDVHLIGVKVAELAVGAAEGGARYSAAARLVTTGLARALKDLRADVAVTGRMSGGALAPLRYREEIDNGRRVSRLQVQYAGGRPVAVSGDSGSDAPAADKAALSGALDPMTVLYTLLRDQPAASLCTLDAPVFDGHRHAHIDLTRTEQSPGQVTCSGEYRRVSGYTAKERREKAITMSIDYAARGDAMRATRVRVQTRYGPAVLTRR
jgi:hypothetical protein